MVEVRAPTKSGETKVKVRASNIGSERKQDKRMNERSLKLRSSSSARE